MLFYIPSSTFLSDLTFCTLSPDILDSNNNSSRALAHCLLWFDCPNFRQQCLGRAEAVMRHHTLSFIATSCKNLTVGLSDMSSPACQRREFIAYPVKGGDRVQCTGSSHKEGKTEFVRPRSPLDRQHRASWAHAARKGWQAMLLHRHLQSDQARGYFVSVPQLQPFPNPTARFGTNNPAFLHTCSEEFR